ncbi:MAG: recombinase family protein [Boseongicola sp. SB0677_bin_26]|nr:recombinase family protein [Boseongicola sp. SB0677_bin_26]
MARVLPKPRLLFWRCVDFPVVRRIRLLNAWRLTELIRAPLNERRRELIVENTRAGLEAARRQGRRGGLHWVMDDERRKQCEAMLRDTRNYPFVGNVIDALGIGRTAFCQHFPPGRIRELRPEHDRPAQPHAFIQFSFMRWRDCSFFLV